MRRVAISALSGAASLPRRQAPSGGVQNSCPKSTSHGRRIHNFTEEVTGSNPVAPTSNALTSRNAGRLVPPFGRRGKRTLHRLGRGLRSWDRCDGDRLSDQRFPRLAALFGERARRTAAGESAYLRSVTDWRRRFATWRISSSRAAAVAWPCGGRPGAPRGADSGHPTPLARRRGTAATLDRRRSRRV
jgi:hypothetical protein